MYLLGGPFKKKELLSDQFIRLRPLYAGNQLLHVLPSLLLPPTPHSSTHNGDLIRSTNPINLPFICHLSTTYLTINTTIYISPIY